MYEELIKRLTFYMLALYRIALVFKWKHNIILFVIAYQDNLLIPINILSVKQSLI